MLMNNLFTQSKNFSGKTGDLLLEIRTFLSDVAKKNQETSHLHLVHALVFDESMTEKETLEVNEMLANIYRETGFSVLGGDTSSGSELNIFISTIVY